MKVASSDAGSFCEFDLTIHDPKQSVNHSSDRWMVPLFRKGNKQDIEFQDLCRCCKEDETAFLSKEIAINWERQLQREHPSLMRAIIATFWRKYALIALAILVNVRHVTDQRVH